jgi:hypothetical protein
MISTVHPDDRARVLSATFGCTPERPTCRVRYRVLRPDDSVIWLEKNAHAFFDENGKMVRMIGMIADISERKLAEEAISDLSRRLIEAQEAERARIARELHDDISQRLALLSVSFERVKRAVPVSQANSATAWMSCGSRSWIYRPAFTLCRMNCTLPSCATWIQSMPCAVSAWNYRSNRL